MNLDIDNGRKVEKVSVKLDWSPVNSLRETIAENPLTSVALAGGVGFVAGYTLRPTIEAAWKGKK